MMRKATLAGAMIAGTLTLACFSGLVRAQSPRPLSVCVATVDFKSRPTGFKMKEIRLASHRKDIKTMFIFQYNDGNSWYSVDDFVKPDVHKFTDSANFQSWSWPASEAKYFTDATGLQVIPMFFFKSAPFCMQQYLNIDYKGEKSYEVRQMFFAQFGGPIVATIVYKLSPP